MFDFFAYNFWFEAKIKSSSNSNNTYVEIFISKKAFFFFLFKNYYEPLICDLNFLLKRMNVLIRNTVQFKQIWCPLRVSINQIHLSSLLGAGKIWRQKHGLPKLQTAKGPLIDLPDYSFIGN